MRNFFCPLKCHQTLMQGKACHRSSVPGTNQNLIKTNCTVVVTPEIIFKQDTNAQNVWFRWQHVYNLHSAITNFSQELIYLLLLLVIKERNLGGQSRTRKMQYAWSILLSPLQGEGGDLESSSKRNKNTFWVFFWSTVLVFSVWQSIEISEQAGQTFYSSQQTLNSH